MVRHFLGATVWTAIAWSVGGCSLTPKLEPKGHASVPVGTEGSTAVASVHVLDEVQIRLPPITTPGNQWIIVLNDSRFLEQRKPIVELGDGKGFVATFLAIHTGRRLIRFYALPIGSDEAVPTQSYEAVINIE
ncbi:MAG TPA: hypothetical protein VHE61_23670 [Opitutaceae bacterium]|nr:hypothetical protein [Opitutaceae bacterium]